MLSRAEFAKLIDGDVLDQRIDEITSRGIGWIQRAQLLSRRVNGTVGWENLGPKGARYSLLENCGESVIFADQLDKDIVYKLRGQETNGFEGTGFGCVLIRNKGGLVDLGPGTLEQALERERLCWEVFGFACEHQEIIEENSGLILSQYFIAGDRPTIKEIHQYMSNAGWEWQGNSREISSLLCSHAWKKENLGAFDANETNFLKSKIDGQLYPIDLIVWHWPV